VTTATKIDFQARTHASTVSFHPLLLTAQQFIDLYLELDLPEYESYDILRQQVLMAITAGSEYFGFA
jgi:hypothetical protein